MSGEGSKVGDMLDTLRQEFVETARDQLDDIEVKLDFLETEQGDAEQELLSIQRHIHNIKGQGGTFGFPITGRTAHMLEDYLINAEGIRADNISDIRAYLDLMGNLIMTGESIAQDNSQSLLNALPTGQMATFSTQKIHDISILLVMPSGLQRKLVAKELLSCGFRVMRAYDSVEALSVALDITPDIVFVNYDMAPFNGRELSNVFAAVDQLRDIHFVLLTSYEDGNENLQNLPDNISVIHKHTNFTESIGELLIQWGVFGNIPHETKESNKAISQHPKTVRISKSVTQRSLNILLAEDNRLNQRLIKETIEAYGHRVELAGNGMEAIEAHKAGDYDLILMDVRMPEMGGPDATRAIRKLPADKCKIPIVAVTADATDAHKKEYAEVGMNDCVTKPIDRAELFATINEVMGEDIHVEVEVEVSESGQDEIGPSHNIA